MAGEVIQVDRGFRGDINGLRAWAVVAVVLYHFDLPGFGGGYVGVDVFFVISGLLMTAIVAGGLQAGRFSLWRFYLARARRIVPALVVLCATLVALGWFALPANEYRTLGSHALYSLGFLSNVKFVREAGYFDAASHEKWLLHTWSLSVEWQFYLLFPLVLLAAWKLRPGRRTIVVAVVAGGLLSLAAALTASPLQHERVFYLLPTRAWELLAGGMVYLLAQTRQAQALQRHGAVLEALGLALIVGAVVGFDAGDAWPDWRTLVPVSGTALVLLASRARSRWTGSRVAQWLGTTSYSLYLWHWPVAVALVYLERQREPLGVVAGLGLTLALGGLSYALVEYPARRGSNRARPVVAAWGLALAVAAVAAPAALIRSNQGLPDRLPSEVARIEAEANNYNPRRDECHGSGARVTPSCRYGGDRVRAVVVGDSHAYAVVTAVEAALGDVADGVVEHSYSACPTIAGAQMSRGAGEGCRRFNDWVLARLDTYPADVALIVVNRSTHYLAGVTGMRGHRDAEPLIHFGVRRSRADEAFLAEYEAYLARTLCPIAGTRPVYLVRPLPEFGVDVPRAAARLAMSGKPVDVSIPLSDYRSRHAAVWAAQDAVAKRCGVRLLDPLPYLCPGDRCHATKEGLPLYFDDDHPSERGNRLLVPMFAPVFEER